MIICSAGIPGPFAAWCDDLVQRLVGLAIGPAASIRAHTAESFRKSLAASNSSHAIVSSTKPKQSLRAMMADAAAPFVVALDDPRQSVAYLTAQRKISLAAAIRQVSESCAAIAELATEATALLLHAEEHDPSVCTDLIIRHLGSSLGTSEQRRLRGEIGISRTSREASVRKAEAEPAEADLQAPGSWKEQFDERERKVIDGALSPFASYFRGRSPGEMVWHRELFTLGEDSDHAPMDAIDVTGRARTLFTGPRLFLPRGTWGVRMVLGFSPELAGIPFRVRILCGKAVLLRRIIQPESGGVFELAGRLANDSADQPVLVRVASGQPVFDGRLVLGAVSIRPQTMEERGRARKPPEKH